MATLDDLLARARRRRALPDPPLRRMLRERAGLTQGEIAGLLRVSRVAVTRWEGGRRTPRGVHRKRYADLLDRLAREAL